MGKIQSMDSLLFEFNLSELNINSKVFIYEGTLLDEFFLLKIFLTLGLNFFANS